MNSWRPKTKTQYDSYIKQYSVFCIGRGKDPTRSNLSLGLDFLYSLHEKGLSYSAINSARSALSSYMSVGSKNLDFGTHRLVIRFMKGIFNLKPCLPRYSNIWDPNVVLSFLYKLSPRRKLSLKLLTLKCVALLALISVQRVQTIHCINVDDVSFSEHSVQIIVNSTLKTSRPNWHLHPLVFHKYSNKQLCIVRYLRQYIARTRSIRGDETRLFISFNKPHSRVTTSTIGRWIKTVLHRSGIDISTYKAHSTRAASASKAYMHVPTAKVLSAGGWSSSNSFQKHYNLPVMSSSSVQNAVLDGN